MQNAMDAGVERPLLAPELEIKVYLRLIWRWLWLIILCGMVGGVAAYVFSQLSTPIYQASSTLMIDEGNNITANYQDILTAERKARTYAELMTRDSTLAEVAAQLNLTPQSLENDLADISVTPLRDTQLLKVQIEGISPSLVTLVADTLPAVFIQELNRVQGERFVTLKAGLQDQLDDLTAQIDLVQVEISQIDDTPTAQEEIALTRLRSTLGQKQGDYARLLQNLEELRITEAQSGDSVVVVESASQPVTPIRPRVLVNTLLATIVGVMLALGVVFLIEYLDDRIKSPRQLLQLVDLPILGSVVRFQTVLPNGVKQGGGLVTLGEPRNPVSEAFRGIRTNLQFANVDKPIRSLVITSAMPGEGKTTVAGNLAVVLAQAGLSVALVDADLRKPTVHKLFNISSQPGLVDNLLSPTPEEIRFSPERQLANLHLLPSGKRPPNPAELLGSKRMMDLVEHLKQTVDFVILDTPPLLAAADAYVLASMVDVVVLVTTAGVKRDAVLRTLEELAQVRAPLIGSVFNRLERATAGSYYYYYSDYYGDAHEDRGPSYNMAADLAAYELVMPKQRTTNVNGRMPVKTK
ncbi:MAG: polysaccharide biosynthesis tyrosine autokinase [Caldilineaceae bacterium]